MRALSNLRRVGRRGAIAQGGTQGQGFTPTDEDKYVMRLGRQALLSSGRLVSFADSFLSLFDLCSSGILLHILKNPL